MRPCGGSRIECRNTGIVDAGPSSYPPSPVFFTSLFWTPRRLFIIITPLYPHPPVVCSLCTLTPRRWHHLTYTFVADAMTLLQQPSDERMRSFASIVIWRDIEEPTFILSALNVRLVPPDRALMSSSKILSLILAITPVARSYLQRT